MNTLHMYNICICLSLILLPLYRQNIFIFILEKKCFNDFIPKHSIPRLLFSFRKTHSSRYLCLLFKRVPQQNDPSANIHTQQQHHVDPKDAQ